MAGEIAQSSVQASTILASVDWWINLCLLIATGYFFLALRSLKELFNEKYKNVLKKIEEIRSDRTVCNERHRADLSRIHDRIDEIIKGK